VPYAAASAAALYDAIRGPAPVALPDAPVLSAALAQLLLRLLDKDPASRITLAQARAGPRMARD
jgi:hypothetical protein